MSTLARLRQQGFDRSANTFGRPNLVSVACSQCQATVVNGVPVHEHRCPNQTFECRGCNAQVSRRGSYCEDCQ